VVPSENEALIVAPAWVLGQVEVRGLRTARQEWIGRVLSGVQWVRRHFHVARRRFGGEVTGRGLRSQRPLAVRGDVAVSRRDVRELLSGGFRERQAGHDRHTGRVTEAAHLDVDTAGERHAHRVRLRRRRGGLGLARFLAAVAACGHHQQRSGDDASQRWEHLDQRRRTLHLGVCAAPETMVFPRLLVRA